MCEAIAKTSRGPGERARIGYLVNNFAWILCLPSTDAEVDVTKGNQAECRLVRIGAQQIAPALQQSYRMPLAPVAAITKLEPTKWHEIENAIRGDINRSRSLQLIL